jgi:hypothetical protein
VARLRSEETGELGRKGEDDIGADFHILVVAASYKGRVQLQSAYQNEGFLESLPDGVEVMTEGCVRRK